MNQRKTAFLIFQGLSGQKPLEALDCFARGFLATLRKTVPDGRIVLSHRLPLQAGREDSYVRIAVEGGQTIDLYEYGWGSMTGGQCGIADVADWLLAVSDGAKAFYEAHPELVAACDRPLKGAFRNDIMETNWYLARLGGLFRALALIDQVFPASQWVRLGDLLRRSTLLILGFVHKQAAGKLVEYLADIAAYSQADRNLVLRQAREEALQRSLQLLKTILQSPEGYDQVVLAGHSLGSVIAYDTVNRLIQAINAEPSGLEASSVCRLKGLVTFGSPLDKVAFIYRFRSQVNDFIRRQLIRQRHGFRAKEFDIIGFRRADVVMQSPYQRHLDDQMAWINYWDAKDFVSGHFDFYRTDENVQCEISGGSWDVHRNYWEYMPMYQDIARRFLGEVGAA